MMVQKVYILIRNYHTKHNMTQIQTRETCTICNGEGTLETTKINACTNCKGDGYIYSDWQDCEISRLPVVGTDGKTLRYMNTVIFREEI